MKVAVTGATGNFATGAITGLLKVMDPNDLILFSRKPEKLAHYKEMGCDTRFGDYEKPESLPAALKGADKVMMISGHHVGHRIPQHTACINAAKQVGVKHIVYTSYFGSDEDNTALVCQDHYGTEKVLKASGLAFTIMRDGLYMDTAGNAMIPGSYAYGNWVHAAGDGKISLVDRRDVFACAVAILTTPGHEFKTYNITGDELFSFEDIAKIAWDITGNKFEMLSSTEDDFYRLWMSRGIPRDASQEFNVGGFEWCCDDMISFEREVRVGKFAILSHDIEKLLGRPAKTLKDFMLERADMFKKAAEKGVQS
jgi:NAD(P)H dehydrogenase (quinone)